MGVSEGDEGLEGKPHPPECTEELITNEMGPQAEGEACAETEGNLVFRTVCNVEGFNAQAISLPEGRAAGCFDIEAIRGSNIVFEIVRESDGAVEFDTSMGKDAFHTLVLVGPGGLPPEGICPMRANESLGLVYPSRIRVLVSLPPMKK